MQGMRMIMTVLVPIAHGTAALQPSAPNVLLLQREEVLRQAARHFIASGNSGFCISLSIGLTSSRKEDRMLARRLGRATRGLRPSRRPRFRLSVGATRAPTSDG